MSTMKERTLMLFFVKVRVKHEGMSLDELWSLWETEAEAALGACPRLAIVTRLCRFE